MSRYIDADKLYEDMQWSIQHDMYDKPFDYLAEIDCQPTADVRENVKGEWTKEAGYVAGDREWKCSICGETFWNGSMKRYHYCPNCGADMRGEA